MNLVEKSKISLEDIFFVKLISLPISGSVRPTTIRTWVTRVWYTVRKIQAL